MKILNSFGPNPRMLRMFLAEKGLKIDMVEYDLLAGENRDPGYLTKNPGGQMPALELDNGTILAETVIICDYLEELYPTPALIGTNPQDRAEARMWNRRIEQKITGYIYDSFQFGEGIEMFKSRRRCLPEAVDGLKASAQDGLAWLDQQMEGKKFICGDRITIADLVLYCCTNFSAGVGQTINSTLGNVKAWSDRIDQRPSAEASLHPAAERVGMRG